MVSRMFAIDLLGCSTIYKETGNQYKSVTNPQESILMLYAGTPSRGYPSKRGFYTKALHITLFKIYPLAQPFQPNLSPFSPPPSSHFPAFFPNKTRPFHCFVRSFSFILYCVPPPPRQRCLRVILFSFPSLTIFTQHCFCWECCFLSRNLYFGFYGTLEMELVSLLRLLITLLRYY